MEALAARTGAALAAATDALAAAGVPSPRLDAELLLADAAGIDRAGVILAAADPLPPRAARRFGELVRRRLRREPVAYILGRRGFRRIELAVDGRVLIPRPESELLVELALELQPRSLLDVGTGSGAIALAVADELPACAVTASDASAAALELARANAERLGLAGRVEFLLATLPAAGGFDLILANLPYVAERDWAALAPEITEWEPHGALLAGADGLEAIRALLSAPRLPAPVIGLEVGAGQAGAVAALLGQAGFGAIQTRLDLAGIERLVIGRRERPA